MKSAGRVFIRLEELLEADRTCRWLFRMKICRTSQLRVGRSGIPHRRQNLRFKSHGSRRGSTLETINLASWSSELPPVASEPVRGWLVSPLHPMAHAANGVFRTNLLATPAASTLFLDHIATLGRAPVVYVEPTVVQNRFRLSRMKVNRTLIR